MNAGTILDVAASAVTVAAAAWGYFAWYPNFKLRRLADRQASKTAMEQINHFAENCFPTMQAALKSIDAKTDETNKILEALKESSIRTETKFDTLIQVMEKK